MSKHLHYLYLTINKINGKQYIGQRKCPFGVLPEDDNYLGSGTRLLYALKKYGKENFSKEILSVCESQSEVDAMEINFIKENNVLGNKEKWYNIDAGGQYGRSEEHSIIKSITMKDYYSNPESLTKVIEGKNIALIKKGFNPLPYNNHSEYLIFSKEKKTLLNIRKLNNNKIDNIKRLKRKSKQNVYMLYKLSDEYLNREKERTLNANIASNNPISILKRKQSQKQTWHERKQSSKDIWNSEAKMSFALGKLKQYNNPIGLYLISNNVSLRIDNLQKKIKKVVRPYKDENNRNKQIDNIINSISNNQNIIINRQSLIELIRNQLNAI